MTIAQNNNNLKAKLVADKGPVMLLNELHPSAQFEIVSENGEQYNKYTTAVTIDGQRWGNRGSDCSKNNNFAQNTAGKICTLKMVEEKSSL